MSHGIEVDAALALLAGPGDRVWWTPIVGIVHPLGVKNEQDVDVLREVLERVPFFLDGEGFTPPPGKLVSTTFTRASCWLP